MNQQYPQLDPVRSNPPLADADAQAYRTSDGVDPKTIEALKAARDQVVQADKGGSAVKSIMPEGQNQSPKQTPYPLGARTPDAASRLKSGLPLTGFVEEFVQKLASIEQKTAAVDEEMAKVEKFWANLVEKKKQLEARRNELIKVKDKLKELDKEMSDVLEK